MPAVRGGPYLTAMYKGVIPCIKFISNDIFSVDGVIGGGTVKGLPFSRSLALLFT